MRYTYEEWREVARVFYAVTRLTGPDRFAAEACLHRHDRLICTDARFSAQRFEHVLSRIKGIDHNYLLYERYLAGSARGLAADVPTRIDQSTIHLIDMSRNYHSISEDVVTAGVCIPHDVIGYDPSEDPPYRGILLNTPQGRMLDLAHGAFRSAAAEGSADAGELAAAFIALVGTLMLKKPARQPNAQSDHRCSAPLRAHVVRNLTDPELTPTQICRQLGVSRSVLYREFQPDGGVARFIAEQRLDRCFADLAAAPARRGAVRAVAERWGFLHPGNFHRSFRERFGVSPSDCLSHETGQGPAVRDGGYHPVHEWLRADWLSG